MPVIHPCMGLIGK